MANFLDEQGLQPLTRFGTDVLVLEPVHDPDQDGVGRTKGQLGVLDKRAGKVGRCFSTFGQYGGTLIDDVRGF
jgi:hypothetical protein